MVISDKIAVQEIVKLVKRHQIKDVVLSPGSRNAPFIISFANDSYFNCHQIVDERSAAFFALGIAQKTKKPVILSCTSGSAALNYAPAILEAYTQGIPLLVITSDRPANGFETGEGQCFNQVNIYNNYIKHQVNLIEQELDPDQESEELLKQAFNELNSSPFGPIHINVPFNEPLYNTVELEEAITPIKDNSSDTCVNKLELQTLLTKWNTFHKKLFIVSQGAPTEITNDLAELQKIDSSVYILQENTSNTAHQLLNSCIDRTIKNIGEDMKSLQPDLIITIGNNIISKIVKQQLRAFPPKQHWSFHNHLNQNVFKLNSNHFKWNVKHLLTEVINKTDLKATDYQKNWKTLEQKVKKNHITTIGNTPFSDLKVFNILLNHLPACHLQLANSSVVRYTQLFNPRKDISFYANRGVSGIDGSTSTAVGFSVYNKQLTVLVTGDLSFFYDSNAFWNTYKNNMLVVVINNGGGSIFKIIDGPTKNTKAQKYFTAENNLSIERFSTLHNLPYTCVKNVEQLINYLTKFDKETDDIHVLEVDTKDINNEEILKQYFKHLNK